MQRIVTDEQRCIRGQIGPPLRGRPGKPAGVVARVVRATSPACPTLLTGELSRTITDDGIYEYTT